MKDNNDDQFLTMDDLEKMWWKEQIRLGKIKTIATMSLVDGEWVFNYDSKKSLVEKEVTQTIEIPKKQWFNLKEACELKNVNYRSICNKPWLKPNNGTPDGIVNGRKCWLAETIARWLNQTDDELKEMYRKRKQP